MQLYCAPPNSAADSTELLQAFSRLPAGQDFVDGQQHDCQEFLHNLIDALHEDLVSLLLLLLLAACLCAIHPCAHVLVTWSDWRTMICSCCRLELSC